MSVEQTPSSAATRITRTGRQATVSVTGEIDIGTSPGLDACLERCLAEGCTEIVLDVTEMTFIDSSGLAVVAFVTKALKLRGGRVTLRNASPTVQKLLDIVGLAAFFEVVPSV